MHCLGLKNIAINAMSVLLLASGAVVMPAVSHQGALCREFRVPYIFGGNSRVRCNWTADAGLGAAGRVVDIALIGYYVRAGLIVRPAPVKK